MKITYELYGRSIWHSDCVEGRKNGVMKPIKHEVDRTLMECQHCGARGFYPVGAVGEIEVEQINLTADVVDQEETGLYDIDENGNYTKMEGASYLCKLPGS